MGSIQGEVFPVIYSTLSGEALISLVLSQYNIQAVESCQLWHRGLSDVYLVITKIQRYILRISHSHWRTKSEIDFELELLDFFHQHQLPVAYPLQTQDGDLSIEINAPEGKRYAALFPYADGEIALGDLNPTQSHKLGETLAKLHQTATIFHPCTSRQALSLQYLLDYSLGKIIPLLQHRQTDLHYLLSLEDQIKDKLQDLPTKPPFWVVCWGDPHSGNAHFKENGELTLFDFDQCGYGWRAFDIAKFLQISLRTGIRKQVREGFLNGYSGVWKLTEKEVASLQSLTQVAHLWVWAINIHSALYFDYSRLDDPYLNHRLAQLKQLKSPSWQLF